MFIETLVSSIQCAPLGARYVALLKELPELFLAAFYKHVAPGGAKSQGSHGGIWKY